MIRMYDLAYEGNADEEELDLEEGQYVDEDGYVVCKEYNSVDDAEFLDDFHYHFDNAEEYEETEKSFEEYLQDVKDGEFVRLDAFGFQQE